MSQQQVLRPGVADLAVPKRFAGRPNRGPRAPAHSGTSGAAGKEITLLSDDQSPGALMSGSIRSALPAVLVLRMQRLKDRVAVHLESKHRLHVTPAVRHGFAFVHS
jgi:hypothetical protein